MRIFQNITSEGLEQSLSDPAHHHVTRVLRVRIGDSVQLFDGEGRFTDSEVIYTGKKITQVKIGPVKHSPKPGLRLHLAQALSKGDRMDYAIQKSVELGVTEITPILTQRCEVKLNAQRKEKKLRHWQQIIRSACEQCGQNYVPILNPIILYDEFINRPLSLDQCRLILTPYTAQNPLLKCSEQPNIFEVIIGAEGGFTTDEIDLAMAGNAQPWQLGGRVLRTETAPVVALSILQYEFGDY